MENELGWKLSEKDFQIDMEFKNDKNDTEVELKMRVNIVTDGKKSIIQFKRKFGDVLIFYEYYCDVKEYLNN